MFFALSPIIKWSKTRENISMQTILCYLSTVLEESVCSCNILLLRRIYLTLSTLDTVIITQMQAELFLFVILVIKFTTWLWSRIQIQIWITTRRKSIHPWPMTRADQKSTFKLLKYAYSRLYRLKLNFVNGGSDIPQICKVNLVLRCDLSDIIYHMVCLLSLSDAMHPCASICMCVYSMYCAHLTI